jgi:hypothetical protein
MINMPQPDFTLPDPQRAAFEHQYRGKRRPHFNGGDITSCRPMTKLELEQYREYLDSQRRSHSTQSNEYQLPF